MQGRQIPIHAYGPGRLSVTGSNSQDRNWFVGKGVTGSDKELFEKFGPNATKDWWHMPPATKGQTALKMKEIVRELETAAANHECFDPGFAGGAETLLVRMDKVVFKRFSQCVHLTAVGLPFASVDEAETEVPPDQMPIVGSRVCPELG